MPTPEPTATDEFPGGTTESATLLAAGDIASCTDEAPIETAELVEQYPEATVATLGDTVYPRATAETLRDCYAPNWGQFADRTRPALGNHDYQDDHATPFFEYFGEVAGIFGEGGDVATQGYYSYDIGAWHIIVLNSNCSRVGGCGKDSPQVPWLREDLQRNRKECTLAYWHHPRWGSGRHGNDRKVDAFWTILYDAGAEIVLNGHDHSYERLAPMDDDGDKDEEHGIREFIVGTGGKDLYDFEEEPLETTEVRESETFGVLKLELHPGSYEWEFLPIEGQSFTDSGSGTCHAEP